VPIEQGDVRSLIQLAKREHIGLTVVGPEEPLVKRIVDALRKGGVARLRAAQGGGRAGGPAGA
jgi:phosphoribosylamine--glycine ligase